MADIENNFEQLWLHNLNSSFVSFNLGCNIFVEWIKYGKVQQNNNNTWAPPTHARKRKSEKLSHLMMAITSQVKKTNMLTKFGFRLNECTPNISRLLFCLFSSFLGTVKSNYVLYKILSMTGFEPRISGIGSDRWPTITARMHLHLLALKYSRWLVFNGLVPMTPTTKQP